MIKKQRTGFCITLLLLFSPFTFKAQPNADSIPTHDSIKIVSALLQEPRVINVWLPDDYSNTTHAYPVLYMLDGGIKEDFPHLANTISQLIKDRKIEPIILVGIENTQRRRDLTGPTRVKRDKKIAPVVGKSQLFRNFIAEELIPEINNRYRTNSKKGIIGESLAGLFVMETFFNTPLLFDFYIAFDPSLWWNKQYLLRKANKRLNLFPEKQKKLWFSASGQKEISEAANSLSTLLESKNIKQLQWKFLPAPDETHQTIFRATKEKALIWSLGLSEN